MRAIEEFEFGNSNEGEGTGVSTLDPGQDLKSLFKGFFFPKKKKKLTTTRCTDKQNAYFTYCGHVRNDPTIQ